ncbi:MAG: hypothetical protein BHV99_06150 [Clostridium sp. 26_21]|nr:MAG: hypothetical protein BHV99_06150 [Clostridium sp. 26_21]
MKKSNIWVNNIQESLLNEAKKLISNFLDSQDDSAVDIYPNQTIFVSLSTWNEYVLFCRLYENKLFPKDQFHQFLHEFGWEYRYCAKDLIAIPVSPEDEEDSIK